MDNRILKSMSVSLAAAIVTIAAGCGGGGGGGGGIGGPVAGIDRLGVSTGTVTGFGSIFVNGVEFETNSAEFRIDDSPGSQDDLSIGDVVIVSFDPDVSPTAAKTVFADEAVEGPVDSINVAAGELVVAGQTVLVDANTSFDDSIVPRSLDGLSVGDFVEVSGLFDAPPDFRIHATRIELKPTGSEPEVHGVVRSLDATAGTFRINALTVNYLSVPGNYR